MSGKLQVLVQASALYSLTAESYKAAIIGISISWTPHHQANLLLSRLRPLYFPLYQFWKLFFYMWWPRGTDTVSISVWKSSKSSFSDGFSIVEHLRLVKKHDFGQFFAPPEGEFCSGKNFKCIRVLTEAISIPTRLVRSRIEIAELQGFKCTHTVCFQCWLHLNLGSASNLSPCLQAFSLL